MSQNETQKKAYRLAGSLVLLLASFLVYLPALRGGYVWDDTVSLTENPFMPRRDGLYYFWFTSAPHDYFPLTFTSFWIEWRLWGANPMGYHLVNVLLHCVSSWLLWRLLARLRIPGAWLAALVFAVHPVGVASVAWIAERKNTLSMVFYLLSLIWYLRFEEGAGAGTEKEEGRREKGESRNDSSPRRWYWLALMAFLLALLAKTSVVVLPGVLLLCLWWRRTSPAHPLTHSPTHTLTHQPALPFSFRDARRLFPFVLLAVVTGLLTVWFQAHRAIGEGTVVQHENLWQRVAAAGWAVWFYLYKALLPIHLSAVYPRWDLSSANVSAFVPLLLLLAVFAAAWRWRARWGRHVIFALGYVVLTFLPVLGFVDMFYLTYSRVADHWAYLPLPAIIALVVGAGARAVHILQFRTDGAREIPNSKFQAPSFVKSTSEGKPEKLQTPSSKSQTGGHSSQRWVLGNWDLSGAWCLVLGALVGALIVASLAFLTWHRAQVYASELSLWSDTVSKNPAAPSAWNNLGLALLKDNKHSEARHALEEALRIKPGFLEALSNMGFLLDRLGRHQEATGYYEKAVQTNPRFAPALNNLGVNLIEQGKTNEGVAQFIAALSVNPYYPASHENLAAHLLKRGAPDEALPHALQALEIDRENPDAYYIAGNCWFMRGEMREAAENYATACRLRPDFADARHNLAVALNKLGRSTEATANFAQAAALRPNDPNLKLQQGIIMAQAGQLHEAVEQFRGAVRLRPQDAEGHNRLGFILAKQGKFDPAVVEFKEALRLNPGSADAHKNLANAWRELGRPEQALMEMQEAVRLQPTNGNLHAHFGDLLASLGKGADAAAQFKEALRFEPENLTAHFGLGNWFFQQGGLAEAREHYLAALKVRPDFPEAHFQLALVYEAGHDFKEGRRHLEAAVQGRPDWPEALNNLAWLLATQPDAALRDGAQAVRLAERAVELRKGKDPEQLDTLAAAYAEAGRFAQAVQTAQRAIQSAKAGGQTNLAQAMEPRLRLYEAQRPYRE